MEPMEVQASARGLTSQPQCTGHCHCKAPPCPPAAATTPAAALPPPHFHLKMIINILSFYGIKKCICICYCTYEYN
uniref:Proline-rich protein n=1 Tax=Pisum sativum TaxID=3888 RepID=Q43624_PEA|nr:proline-rich protein [Pisum sativum]